MVKTELKIICKCSYPFTVMGSCTHQYPLLCPKLDIPNNFYLPQYSYCSKGIRSYTLNNLCAGIGEIFYIDIKLFLDESTAKV